MKFFLSFFIVFLLTLPSFTQSLTFEDDFESYPTGSHPLTPWVTTFPGVSGAVSEDVAVSGTKSFKLMSYPNWTRVETIPITDVPDRILYEGYVWVNETTKGGIIGFGFKENFNTYRCRDFVVFNNAGFIIFAGTQPDTLQTYQAQTWYKVTVYCDFVQELGKVWLNDVLMLNDIPLSTRNEIDDFCLLPTNFSADGLSTSTVYYDDIKIYEEDAPPEISVTVTPDMLWPPNHKMVVVNASVTVNDLIDPDPQVVLESITCNEPDNGKGDGNTNNDIQDADFGTEDYEFSLRAERSGKGDGRVYTITYTATDFAGNSSSASATVTVSHDQDPLKTVADYEMLTNYPNPFNPETQIGFRIPEASFVVIKIYDMLGREIKILTNQNFDAGYHNVTWDGTDINGNTAPSGVYIYRIQAGNFQDTKKMILLK